MASKGVVAILVGASLLVASGGVFVSHKAISQTERYLSDALAFKAQAEECRARLAVMKGRLDDAERRIAEARRGLTKRERQVLAENEVGRPGTLSRKAQSWLNVKANGNPHYWKGQVGIDQHGHAVWKAPEYSLRAGALVLRSYYLRHGISTIDGIVRRFSTSNHDAYIAYLCKHLNLKPDEKFNIIQRIPELIRHMSAFETGRQVPESKIATLDILASI